MEESVLIAIKSGLFVIEKCLREILQETKNDSKAKNWLLKVQHPDISDAEANTLTVKAEEMLKEIQELQRNFNVGKNEESIRWKVICDLHEIWTMLSDIMPDRLHGYGHVRPEDSELLTMHIERMNAIRKEMENALSPRSRTLR